jgi:hypothetical protein
MKIREESRICFGLVWFDNEKEAMEYAKEVHKKGATYNGGYYDGMACGRERGFDYELPDGRKAYAVSE